MAHRVSFSFVFFIYSGILELAGRSQIGYGRSATAHWGFGFLLDTQVDESDSAFRLRCNMNEQEQGREWGWGQNKQCNIHIISPVVPFHSIIDLLEQCKILETFTHLPHNNIARTPSIMTPYHIITSIPSPMNSYLKPTSRP